MTRTALIVLAAALTLIAGCFGGSSPESRFYALSAPAAAAPAAAAAYSVSVGPVSVPELVDRPQIVLRGAGSKIELAEFDRWAEPLRSAVARVIAANLASALPDARVAAFSPEGDYRVQVSIQRFESARGDAVTVEALWSVRPARGGAMRDGRSLAREAAGKDFDAIAAAHSKALAAVSGDIAQAIRALQTR